MQGIVFAARPDAPWLAQRSARSLRRAGCRETSIVREGETLPVTGPALFLRAGGWLDPARPFTPPPPSATARAVIALGMPHSGSLADEWKKIRGASGGDFSGATALPPIGCAWLDAATAPEFGATLLREGRLAPGAAAHRILHGELLDFEHDDGLRVAQLVTSLQHGGAERVAWDLHQSLPAHGVASCIVTLGSPLRRMLPAPADWIDLARLDAATRREATRHALAWFGADAIHAHLLDAEEIESLEAAGVPLATTVHNTRAGWPAGLESLNHSTKVLLIACANAVAGELRDAGFVAPLRTVWNGIDTAPFASIRRRPRDGAFVIACVANPRPQKRLHLLPAILAAVREAFQTQGRPQSARLIIAGEASPRSASAQACVEETLREAERHGVTEWIEWTNGAREIREVLAEADVVISPSRHEGLSLAQLEALAAGLSVVATDVGGAREVARRHPALKLLPVDAGPEAFRSAILSSGTTNPEEGAALVARDFSRERMAARCASLYRALHLPRDGDTVWFVTNNLSTGGAQSSLRRLLKRFHADGVRVRVALLQEYPEHPTRGREDLLAAGIPVTVLPPAGSIAPAAAVEQLLGEMSAAPPRAVIFWNVIPVYKILIADAMLRVPVFDVSPGEMFFASLERYFRDPLPGLPCQTPREYGRLLAGAVVKFQAEAAQAEATLGTPVRVIPNGVDVPGPPPPRTRRDRFVIGTAARLSPQKRLEDLIEAFKLALPGLPPCVLRIAGEPETGSEGYAARWKEETKGWPVEWCGETADIAAFHAGLDVFAMISEPAGCPNASLEAMAAGLPVVATDVGGAAEQIVDGVTGLLVPPRDPAALASALVGLAADPGRRQRFGEAAQRRIREHFSLERMVADYRDAFGLTSPQVAVPPGRFPGA